MCVCVCVEKGERKVEEAELKAARPRNAAEEEYLAKLAAIRRQNYLDKKRIMEKAAVREEGGSAAHKAECVVSREQEALEARRKKIAVLKVSGHASLLCGKVMIVSHHISQC